MAGVGGTSAERMPKPSPHTRPAECGRIPLGPVSNCRYPGGWGEWEEWSFRGNNPGKTFPHALRLNGAIQPLTRRPVPRDCPSVRTVRAAFLDINLLLSRSKESGCNELSMVRHLDGRTPKVGAPSSVETLGASRFGHRDRTDRARLTALPIGIDGRVNSALDRTDTRPAG